ncbi:MAG: hypothetical protein ACSHX8_16090 [Opitutaceae bacterium]
MKTLALVISYLFVVASLGLASSPHMPSTDLQQIDVEVFEFKGTSENELFQNLKSLALKEGITLTIKNEGEPIDLGRLHEMTPIKKLSLYRIIQLLYVPNSFASYKYGEDRNHIVVTIRKKLEPDGTGQPM